MMFIYVHAPIPNPPSLLPTHHSGLGHWVWAALALYAALAPVTARAHPLVEDGVRFVQDAEFDAALAVFAAAEEATDLTAPELARLLAHRSLVHFALRQPELMRRDLAHLVAFAPDHPLPEQVPPPVVRAQRQALEHRRAARVVAVVGTGPGSVHIAAEMAGAPDGLVRSVRVVAWDRGSGARLESDAGALRVPVERPGGVRYYVEALGAGGAVVAGLGSPERPRSARAPTHTRRADIDYSSTTEAGSIDPRWWIGGGVVAVTVISVIVAVVASSSNDEGTVVAGPTVAAVR